MGAVYALIADLNAGVMGGVAPAAPLPPLRSLDSYLDEFAKNGSVLVEVGDDIYTSVRYLIRSSPVYPYVRVSFELERGGLTHWVNENTWGPAIAGNSDIRNDVARTFINAILAGILIYEFRCGTTIHSRAERTTTIGRNDAHHLQVQGT